MECPAYSELRRAYDLSMGGSMQRLMLEGDQVKLAGLLTEIWSIRHNVIGISMETLEPPARTWVVALAEGRGLPSPCNTDLH